MSRPLHAVIVSCLVRNPGGELLLIRHPRRGWELPQGHVENGEDLPTAARREVREETGMTVEIERLLAVFSKLDPEPSAVIFGFLARPTGGTPTPSDESLEVAWVPETEALRRVEHPVNRDRLQQLLQGGERVEFHAYHMSPFRRAP